MNPHFASLVVGLAYQANAALDGTVPAGTEAAGSPKEQARALIDTLAMLADKTAGRLDDEEDRLLTESLTGLRFRFVQSSTGS